MSIENTIRRSSNFELLRIFCMLSVVAVHYSWHGGSALNGSNIELAYFFGNFAQIGVACFVLIGSWFLVDKTFSIERIFNLWKQVVFYSFGISLLIFIISPQHISVKELIKSTMPVIFQQYWFVTPYIILLFLHPFLNRIYNICSRKTILIILFILCAILSIIPSFLIVTNNSLAIKIARFIMYYTIAYSLKRNYISIGWNNNKLNFLVSISCALMMYGISLFALQINKTAFASYYPKGGVSVPVVISSVLLFIGMKNLKISSKLINKISKHTFAVYLISEHCCLWTWAWVELLHTDEYFNAGALTYLCVSTFLIISIFLICIVVDSIMQYIYNNVSIPRFLLYVDKYFRLDER